MQELVDKLKVFIDTEFEAQKAEVLNIWNMPLGSRIRRGKAIQNVRIEKKDTHPFGSRLTVSFTENKSSFKVGEGVILHQGRPHYVSSANPLAIVSRYECQIVGEEDGGLIIETNGYNYVSNFHSMDGWILDATYTDLRRFMLEALDECAQVSSNSLISRILKQGETPILNVSAQYDAEHLLEGLEMNDRQKEAFINAYATESYYLIQGPPGTGKTWLLAQLAHAFAQQGKRVLITSFTNRGINNALKKIHDVTGFNRIAKIGQARDADGLGEVQNYEQFRGLYSVEDGGFIIGGTGFAVRTKRLQNVEFDIVIFDEASQINLPNAISSMLTGQKYIFIGDHQQMPPVIAGTHKEEEVKLSIFERLFSIHPGTMLDTTYRMNQEIADFASQAFYNGQLYSHESVADERLQLLSYPTDYADILDPNYPSIFLDLPHRDGGSTEENEAFYVADIIRVLLQSGISAEDIAVVAPYRAQSRLIRQKLLAHNPTIEIEELKKITVDTVEKMQGQERDVILFSLTTSNVERAAQRAEFYFLPNRLNVSITRARYKRIVVGSSNLFNARLDTPELQQWLDVFKQFYNSCHIVDSLPLLKKNRQRYNPTRRRRALPTQRDNV